MSEEKARSYRNTALIGISSIINILLSVVRNKIFAVFLGPVGIGQFGILNDFFNSITSIGSLGINNSGVQAVSQATTESDSKVRKIYDTLIRLYTQISLILLALVLVFAEPISKVLSGTTDYALFLRIASIVLVFRFRSVIQNILITGMKRVGLLAKGTVYQGLVTTAIGLVLVYFLRNNAVPYLVLSLGIITWAISHLQSRALYKSLPPFAGYLTLKDLSPVMILGVSSLWASVMESLVTLAGKSWINHYFGASYLGYYQVAVGFTTTYIGFITSSIITDYYPRLVGKVSEGKDAVNQYVNQQIGISMALIMPLLFIMLTFSKLFLKLLFSPEFLAANPLLNYTVAGTFIQVVAWPIAFVFLAHRATKTYIFTETVGNGSMLVLSFFAVRSGIFPMMGLAYVLHYIVYLLVITFLFYRRFSGIITKENIGVFLFNAVIIATIIVSKGFLSDLATYAVGSVLILFYFYRSRKEYAFMFRTVFRKR